MMSDPIAPDVVVAPAPALTPQPSVRDLLATSRAAHMNYQAALPRMAAVHGAAMAVAQPGDAPTAMANLKAAAAARAQAELLDPSHSDPSWAEEATTHPSQELLVYYLQQLSK